VVTPIAAASRSASANTILADLPPARRQRLDRIGERRVIARAVAVEPVSVILRHPDGQTARRPRGAEAGDHIHHARGKPASANKAPAASTLVRRRSRPASPRSCCPRQRSARLGGEHRDGGVPGDDDADDADRLAA